MIILFGYQIYVSASTSIKIDTRNLVLLKYSTNLGFNLLPNCYFRIVPVTFSEIVIFFPALYSKMIVRIEFMFILKLSNNRSLFVFR